MVIAPEYHRKRRRCVILLVVLALIIFALAVYSVSVSSFEMTFSEAWEVTWHRLCGEIPDRKADFALWIRDFAVMRDSGPRTVAAILVGIILAVCGAVMQSVTRNPLTDPYTIGISSAAMLGYCISVVYGISVLPFLGDETGFIANAFVFALIPSATIVFISAFKKLSSTMMVLIGIGMMYVFSAMTTLIKFNASEESLQQIYEWGVGTLLGVDWGDIKLLLYASIFALVVLVYFAKDINILSTGDKVAQSLGVNPMRLRVICFVVVSFAVAIAVCFTGTIGFVGLVAPHLARMFTGNDNRLLLPVSATIGALLVLFADVIVRAVPGGLPVGVVTAMIGSPLFIFFLYQQRRKSNF